MKNYTITVNGNIYDVTVEENTSGNQNTNIEKKPKQINQESKHSFAEQPKEIPKEKVIEQKQQQTESNQENIIADAAGKVIAIEKQLGESIQVGDALFILEIMKMETPVVAQKAGTLTSIQVNIGDLVKTGDVLATMKA